MNEPFDLNAMALFARVMAGGSFSEASRRLGVPVSTVSRQIDALERQVGSRLLERTTRALKATEAGRQLLPACQELLETQEQARAVIDQRRREVSGTLRLAAPPSLSGVLLVPLFDGFLRRYPRVSIKVLVTDRHLDLVEDEVDLSLRVGRQPESSLVFRRLLRYRHVLVASPAYLEVKGPLTHPRDLRGHRWLGFGKWFGDPVWLLSNGDGVERVVPALSLLMNDYAGVLQAALDGLGLAEMPSIVCQRAIRDGRLISVLPDWQFEEVDLGAYYLKRRHSLRLVELFLDHCLAEIPRVVSSA